MNVGDLMRRRFDSIGPGAPVAEAVRTMLLTGQEALPVVEDGRLVGILSETDCLRRLRTLLDAADTRKDLPELPPVG